MEQSTNPNISENTGIEYVSKNEETQIFPDPIEIHTWQETVVEGQGTGIVNYGSGLSLVAKSFKSNNFKSGSVGWFLSSSGIAEFNNGRFNQRIGTETTSTASTPTADTVDQWNVTALAVADTFAAPTGTPTDGQELMIRIKDNGTGRVLAWNAIYRASSDLALPTTTTASKTMYLRFRYNAVDVKWDLLNFLNNF